MKSAAIFLAVMLSVSALAAQPMGSPQHASAQPAEAPPPIHNGIWWNNKSHTFQEGFLTGYKSGSTHGAGHLLELNAFPAGELVEGLDSFYKAFQNRNILVDEALVYVQHQLKGESDEKLKAELLKLRAASAPTNVE